MTRPADSGYAAARLESVIRPDWEVTAWLGDQQLGTLPVLSGTVTDSEQDKVRGQVKLTVPMLPELLDPDGPLGNRGQTLTIRRALNDAWVDLGTFLIMYAEPDGEVINVVAQGLMAYLDMASFTADAVFSGSFQGALNVLTRNVISYQLDPALPDRNLPYQAEWKRGDSRLDALWALLQAWPADVTMRGGVMIVRPAPDDSDPGPAAEVYADGDGVDVADVVVRRNLAIDPSMTGSDGWSVGGSATVSVDTAWQLYGQTSLKIVSTGSTGSAAFVERTLNAATWAQPNVQYTVSAYWHCDANTPHGRIRPFLSISIEYADGTSDNNYAVSEEDNPDDLNGRVSVTFTLPSNMVQASVRLINGSSLSGDTIWWDGLLIEEGATLGEYFDGDRPLPGYEARWTGPKNASPSELLAIRHVPGTIVELAPQSDTEQAHNAEVVSTAPGDGSAGVTQSAYITSGPNRWGGPYGRRPGFFASPFLTEADLIPVAMARLRKGQRRTGTYRVAVVTDDRREVGDVVRIVQTSTDTDVICRVTETQHGITAADDPTEMTVAVLSGTLYGAPVELNNYTTGPLPDPSGETSGSLVLRPTVNGSWYLQPDGTLPKADYDVWQGPYFTTGYWYRGMVMYEPTTLPGVLTAARIRLTRTQTRPADLANPPALQIVLWQQRNNQPTAVLETLAGPTLTDSSPVDVAIPTDWVQLLLNSDAGNRRGIGLYSEDSQDAVAVSGQNLTLTLDWEA